MSDKGLVGDLKSMPLPDVFQWISLSNRAGELVLQSEFENISVFFVAGKISYAYTNNPKFLLGQLLLRYKKINKSQLAKTLSIQKKIKKPLGQIFVSKNIISKEELNEIIKIQIQEIIYHLLKWESGFFSFINKDIKTNFAISLLTDELLMEGMRRIDEENRISKYLKPESIPVLVNTDLTGGVFDLIDGNKCVGEILTLYGMDEFATLEKIYNLLESGDIKIDSFKNDYNDVNPILKFLIALELFNKGKIYDSYNELLNIINMGYKNEQVIRFFDSLKIYIAKYFNTKYGGNNTCFDLNKNKFLDTTLYVTPTEGFILSRIEEYPCVHMLHKVSNLSYEELYLIVDKLYKTGLLHLKSKERYKSEVMRNDLIENMIKIYKEKLSGELEIITEKGKFYIYLFDGKIKFIYSFSEDFSIVNFLSEKKQISSDGIMIRNIGDYLEAVLNNNNISMEEFSLILEVYQTMIFYELLSQQPISVLLTYDKDFIYDFKTDFNYRYMIAFAIANDYCKPDNDLDVSMQYKLLESPGKIIKEFGDFEGIANVLKCFKNDILTVEDLNRLDEKSRHLLHILFIMGYIKDCPEEKFDKTIDELKAFLKEIKNKSDKQIFDLKDKYGFDDVKQKYIKLSKKYHPDLFPEKDTKILANEIFEIIKSSYDKLIKRDEPATQNNSELKVDAKKIFMAEQLFTSGQVYLNMGRLPDAVDSFIRAYQNFPEDDEIKAYYGLALIRTGKAREGFKFMKESKFQEFADINLYLAFIDAAIKLGKNKEAKQYIDRAFKKFPDHVKKIAGLELKIK